MRCCVFTLYITVGFSYLRCATDQEESMYVAYWLPHMPAMSFMSSLNENSDPLLFCYWDDICAVLLWLTVVAWSGLILIWDGFCILPWQRNTCSYKLLSSHYSAIVVTGSMCLDIHQWPLKIIVTCPLYHLFGFLRWPYYVSLSILWAIACRSLIFH